MDLALAQRHLSLQTGSSVVSELVVESRAGKNERIGDKLLLFGVSNQASNFCPRTSQ